MGLLFGLQQTTAGFTAGLNSILKTLPDMLKTMKDPSISTRALSELLAEDANNISVRHQRDTHCPAS